MRAEDNKTTYRMNIGGASIILILLVFSMTIFAILSIRASYHELKLARNSKDYVEQYYAADTKAEEVYAGIYESVLAGHDLDTIVQQLAQDTSIKEVIAEDSKLSFSIDINQNSRLVAELTIDGNNVLKNKWQMKVTELSGYTGDTFEIWQSDWFE